VEKSRKQNAMRRFDADGAGGRRSGAANRKISARGGEEISASGKKKGAGEEHPPGPEGLARASFPRAIASFTRDSSRRTQIVALRAKYLPDARHPPRAKDRRARILYRSRARMIRRTRRNISPARAVAPARRRAARFADAFAFLFQFLRGFLDLPLAFSALAPVSLAAAAPCAAASPVAALSRVRLPGIRFEGFDLILQALGFLFQFLAFVFFLLGLFLVF
jgi:hypothetical protein